MPAVRRSIAAARNVAIVEPKQHAEIGLADAHRVRQHGLEHGLQLAGRTADDLQHVGGRGLLLEDSVSSLVRACTSSNRRTFSIAITAWSAKVVTKFDLLVGEWSHRLARQK